jgi:hypothetical protein
MVPLAHDVPSDIWTSGGQFADVPLQYSVTSQVDIAGRQVYPEAAIVQLRQQA